MPATFTIDDLVAYKKPTPEHDSVCNPSLDFVHTLSWIFWCTHINCGKDLDLVTTIRSLLLQGLLSKSCNAKTVYFGNKGITVVVEERQNGMISLLVVVFSDESPREARNFRHFVADSVYCVESIRLAIRLNNRMWSTTANVQRVSPFGSADIVLPAEVPLPYRIGQDPPEGLDMPESPTPQPSSRLKIAAERVDKCANIYQIQLLLHELSSPVNIPFSDDEFAVFIQRALTQIRKLRFRKHDFPR